MQTDSSRLDLAAIARELKRARDGVTQIPPLTSRLPGFDVSTAYAVARRVCDAYRAEGAVTVGRKIGFTNSNIWASYGVHAPIWGYVYDRTVVRADDARARLSLAAFAEPQIEPEIAFGLRAAPAAGAGPSALLESIEWVAHGFEIVQSHFPGWKFRAADTVADGGLHGALLVGPRRPVAALGKNLERALESFTVTLSCNGATREVGRGSNVLGSPLAALAHLVAAIASEPGCEPLRQGEIVTTGTLTAAYPVRAGEVWRTQIDGIDLPGMSVELS